MSACIHLVMPIITIESIDATGKEGCFIILAQIMLQIKIIKEWECECIADECGRDECGCR